MEFVDLEAVKSGDLGQYGPVVKLRIGTPDGVWFPREGVDQIDHFNALLDTGAVTSCIDELVAHQLDLPIIDRSVERFGASGPFGTNLVSGLIQVIGMEISIYGRFATLPLIKHEQPYHAILGRDFLSLGILTYDGLAAEAHMNVDGQIVTSAGSPNST